MGLWDVLTFSGVTAAVGGSQPLQLYCHRHNSIIVIIIIVVVIIVVIIVIIIIIIIIVIIVDISIIKEIFTRVGAKDAYASKNGKMHARRKDSSMRMMLVAAMTQ